MSPQNTRRASPAAPLLLATAGCLASVLASPAAGKTVTIGPSDVSGHQLGLGCAGTAACRETYTQVAQPTVGLLLSAPADGVITAWHVHGETRASGRLLLRVLHPEPDGLQFTGVATSPPVTAVESDGSPSHPVSIPIDAGDHIGVDSAQSASADPTTNATLDVTQPSGATLGLWNTGLADGSTSAFSPRSNERLMLNAQIALKPA